MSATYSGVRVLVLGASGFVGRRVAAALSRCGADVIMAVRNAPASQEVLDSVGAGGAVVEHDLTEPGSGSDLIERVRPAVTFNLVGYGVDQTERDEAQAHRLNADLVGELCKAVARSPARGWDGLRFVHCGSAAEYGMARGDLAEATGPQPGTTYGLTKLDGTRRVVTAGRTSRLPAVTARLFTVYGPGEHPGRLLPSLLQAARTGEPLPLTQGLQRRDFTYVDDVVEGLLRLGLSPGDPGETVNLATGRLTSVREFCQVAADILGIASAQLRFGEVPTRASEMDHDPVNVTRLRARLGWAPSLSIEEGIRRTQASA